MSTRLREYIAEQFYELCYGSDVNNEFITDIICLNCGMRVGAHGYDEFVNCAVDYLSDNDE
tara:strand:+ start:165 stop:347 length:183 start_codon:yes stop_codon:yes gene_type:complete